MLAPGARLLVQAGDMRIRGTGYVYQAFDVGFEIDLDRAATRLGIARGREGFRHKRGSPEEAREARWPLRLGRRIAPIVLGTVEGAGPLATSDALEIALYPFGAVSLRYDLALEGELADLVGTSVCLYDNAALQGAAQAEAHALLAGLADAVREPLLAAVVEDYVIYELDPLATPVHELEVEQRELLARILRAERGPLSLHEVENALEGRIAYGPEELVLVDWFSALLIGSNMADERRVLELTAVELLELRFLDERLDRRLDEAYDLLARSRRAGLSPRAREVERLARFQADSAILHENFDNALKLLGDDYLARLYQLASERFHFSAWDTAIERKVATLESIYTKISDLAARRRAELLEWIIIALFVVDIVLYFFG
jgi:hypothetical protein